jgi:hypothetical protein
MKLLFYQFKSRPEAKQRKKKVVERIDKKKRNIELCYTFGTNLTAECILHVNIIVIV